MFAGFKKNCKKINKNEIHLLQQTEQNEFEKKKQKTIKKNANKSIKKRGRGRVIDNNNKKQKQTNETKINKSYLS